MENRIIFESESISELKIEDRKKIADVMFGLTDFINENSDFYITVFKNKENRKIILKINGGFIKQAKIEKLNIWEN